MADRFKYSEVRQKIIDAIRADLIGPREKEEVLRENPRYAYLVGMLDIQSDDEDYSSAGEQEIDADIAFKDDTDFTAGEDDDNEPISTTHFKLPSSMGISFYIQSDTESINLDVTWGDYVKSSEKHTGSDGKEYSRAIYMRQPMKETVHVRLKDFTRTKDYKLVCDSNVHVHVSRIPLKGDYSLVTAYVVNKRKNPANNTEAIMFQVEIKAYSEDGAAVFIAEHVCREILASDEFYFEQRPIMGRGRGCAAIWDAPIDGRTTFVQSAFIPEYEYPGVSAALDGFDRYFFSTAAMAVKSKKSETINRLNILAESYENWIDSTLIGNARMRDPDFKEKIGNKVINRCQDALKRIREGISIIENDDISFEAFCFMNRVIFLQNSIKGYAKKHGTGIECSFKDFINPKKADNNFGWRPFQIAFILMNLAGIVNPKHEDREVVDLLYFPTGGGKTEAYLGLMAFVIANRRLRASDKEEYNRDGGVTVMLRYTLRLLTTQQRDRITKMVLAAEMIRRQAGQQFGKEPIGIGFWVGSGVTPNKFEEFIEKEDNPQAARNVRFAESLSMKKTLKLILIKSPSRFSAPIKIVCFTDIKTTGCLYRFILLMKKYTLSVRPLFCRPLISLRAYRGM